MTYAKKSVLRDMPTPFIPRKTSFWLCHLGGWGLLLLGIYGEYLFRRVASLGVKLSLALAVGLLLFVGGTYTGLIFRRWYYQNRWYEATFQQTLPRMLALSWVSSMVICSLSVLAAYLILGGPPTRILSQSGEPAYLLGIVSNAMGLFPFIVGWCLIYLLIKGTQNSRTFSIRSLELENSLKEARLDALAGQINPHFLFNALNNIRFMIHEDANRADESLTSLSEILRHSLDSSKNEKIEFSQELSIVRQYLELMKNQMENRLSFSIKSDPSLDNMLVPPMMMQMLVENGVKHGIDGHKTGGSITIDCSKTCDALVIKIHNTVASASSSSNFTDFKGSSGVGLDNIGKRLFLLYGERAKFSMSNYENQVLVAIELPIEFSAEAAS